MSLNISNNKQLLIIILVGIIIYLLLKNRCKKSKESFSADNDECDSPGSCSPNNNESAESSESSKKQTLCTEGEYRDLRKKKCIKCPKGYYTDSSGESKLKAKDNKLGACYKCPDNQTTDNVGSTSIDDCKCSQGYKEVNGKCKKESKPKPKPKSTMNSKDKVYQHQNQKLQKK